MMKELFKYGAEGRIKKCSKTVIIISVKTHVPWLCYHGIAHPQVVDGGDELQIWREAVNILNSHWKPTMGGPPACRLGKW
jgi:hypothetical protein